jgi:TolA-binding protein
MHIADSMYSRQNFNEALQCYLQVIEKDRFLRQDFALNFKIGICYLRSKKYEDALAILDELRSNDNPLSEYIDYYMFYAHYQQNTAKYINRYSSDFFRNYADHFLADSVLYHLADYEFSRKNHKIAYNHYTRLQKKKVFKKKKPLILSRMAICKLALKETENAFERMYQIMKKYPSSDEAFEIAQRFDIEDVDEDKIVFAIADVWIKHRQFSLLTQELEKFIKNTSNNNLKEKARFYLLRVYYERGEYQSALYGFNNMLQNLNNKVLESRLRLMIARCYLRVGKMEEAAKSYIEYSKQYPRKRLAAETTWKAAWIYEELGDVKRALKLYKDILKRWPRSQYRYETKFRLGLSYYRIKNYAQAGEIFNEISNSGWSQFHKYRSLYWLAKTYNEVGMSDDAESIYITLGRDIFSSYYTLKSYMLYKEHIDTLMQVEIRLAQVENPLRKYTNHIAELMEKFQRLFLIREILGDDLAFKELSEKRYIPHELDEWVALAEVYKRLGAYNKAFKVYDYIDSKYFGDLESLDKPFLLKESFPLYYDNLIGQYSDQYNIDKNLTHAIIRQESSYDRMAHSWADAHGLMQIIPGTAKQLADELKLDISGLERLYDANLNINMGTYYLHTLLSQYDHKMELALAAYNAGIDFFVENIEFSQTRNYVRLVMRSYWIYFILNQIK